MRSYKILIYGPPYKWSQAYHLKESFEQLGHSADIFDWTQWLYRTKCHSLKNRILDRLLFANIAKNINHNFIQYIKTNKYELIIVLQGLHLFPSTILDIKNYAGSVVNWNPDDFFNALNNSRYLLASFDKYDCIYTSREHLVEEYYRKGAKRVEILDWYYIPNVFRHVEITLQDREKYASDIVFFGSWSKRRENIISCLNGFNLKIWGAQWHKAKRKFRKNIKCNPPVFMEELCKTIVSSKINLNILTKENSDTTNIRNFEIPACAGFQLSERSERILKFFEEDKEIVCFGIIDELIAKCKYYLEYEYEREKIRLNGYKKLTSGDHTILDRAKQLLGAIKYDRSLEKRP